MFKNFFKLFIIVFFSLAEVYSFDLFNSLQKANKGDYIVFSVNKTYTCLAIFEKEENKVVLEEITLSKLKLKPKDAKSIFENIDVPLSHSLVEIDLKDKCCPLIYDVVNNSFLPTQSIDQYLVKFLNLDFKLMKNQDRRKVGVLDLNSTLDNRPVWNPTYYHHGESIKGHMCDGYRSTIPDEIQLIGGKFVEIYYDQKIKDFSFPVWVQICDDAAAFKLISVDLGTNFKSKVKKLPRPLPNFASAIIPNKDTVFFEIDSTYLTSSHRFFYYDNEKGQMLGAEVLKLERFKPTRFKVELKNPTSQGNFSICITTNEDKSILVESLQTVSQKL